MLGRPRRHFRRGPGRPPKAKPPKAVRSRDTPAIRLSARLGDLVRTISSRHGITVDEIASLYRMSRRTVYRDLDLLDRQGYPLVKETQPDGRLLIRLQSGFSRAPQLTLGLAEVISLYVIRAQSHFLAGTNFRADIDALFERFERTMSPGDLAQLRTFHRKFFPLPDAPKSYAKQMDLLDDIIDALIRQYVVTLSYRVPNGEIHPHRLRPYTMLTYKEGLYLIGFSETAGAIRTFAVDRVRKLAVNRGSKFDYPDDYDPSIYCSGSFGIIRGEPVTVRIRFSPRVASFISERRYVVGQKIRKEPDGSVVLAMVTGLTPDLIGWLLGFGDDAEVLEPRSLGVEIAARHHAAAEKYRKMK